jgi:hypothetical protein
MKCRACQTVPCCANCRVCTTCQPLYSVETVA